MAKPLPSIEYLRQRLRYEPDTGKLFWLDYEGMPNNWRARFAGKEAFTYLGVGGYYQGSVGGALYHAHRVIWAIYHGKWPTHHIDHINGVGADNRIVNLRDVTRQENMKNMKMPKNNTSSVTGVVWDKAAHKWKVQIQVDNRTLHLGRFSTFEEAAEARKTAAKKYGFTERHGLPTNVGEACD
jgi:hypothetical protein